VSARALNSVPLLLFVFCLRPSQALQKAAMEAGVSAIHTYTPLLSAAQLTEITKQLLRIMQEAFNRRGLRRAEATVDAEFYDEVAAEQMEMRDEADSQLHFFVRVQCFVLCSGWRGVGKQRD